jgi:hypothetical protein
MPNLESSSRRQAQSHLLDNWRCDAQVENLTEARPVRSNHADFEPLLHALVAKKLSIPVFVLGEP